MRIGKASMFHALVKGRMLINRRVAIPFDKGLAGHSDADVLITGVRRLLGAAALGDIGRHFPDTDPKYKDATAARCCARSRRRCAEPDSRIANVDATLQREAPKMAPHIPAMVANLSAISAWNADR